MIQKEKYNKVNDPINSKDCYVVNNKSRQWGVVNSKNEVIVPFGKYDHIWGYRNGWCLVAVGLGKDSKRGIIDMDGEEIIPIGYYTEIWDFYYKLDYNFIVAELYEVKYHLSFDNLDTVACFPNIIKLKK